MHLVVDSRQIQHSTVQILKTMVDFCSQCVSSKTKMSICPNLDPDQHTDEQTQQNVYERMDQDMLVPGHCNLFTHTDPHRLEETRL